MSRPPRQPVPAGVEQRASAIHRLVAAALAQPLLTAIVALALAAGGLWSFRRLPVDAYPDVSPPAV